MRRIILSTPSNLMAALNLPICRRYSGSTLQYSTVSYSSAPETRVSELHRVDSLVNGCDYMHWLVVMHTPENYPQREEIVQQYIATLAMALGSEKAAKESIYSVSTKYYYAFSCKVSENVIHKIKSLPRVKWVLPDSYLCPEESGYGGEPYVNGKLVPYEEKYHADWLRDGYDEDRMERTCTMKPRRKRRSSRNNNETSE
ncbi:hypothetical protein BUALT_Bualt07G0165100 [Buddleja alternifolia]|uniref:MORF/ORRM1/DAG-like MORF domain-containing protein n=1 Tax=Buddleja alternifolia TaxID=168488 RepID=A0AAV6XFM1_9LAMI|nr:hypothetical protein BUALT_Bualt07G0165100 [Buddleja alternifolia]